MFTQHTKALPQLGPASMMVTQAHDNAEHCGTCQFPHSPHATWLVSCPGVTVFYDPPCLVQRWTLSHIKGSRCPQKLRFLLVSLDQWHEERVIDTYVQAAPAGRQNSHGHYSAPEQKQGATSEPAFHPHSSPQQLPVQHIAQREGPWDPLRVCYHRQLTKSPAH